MLYDNGLPIQGFFADEVAGQRVYAVKLAARDSKLTGWLAKNSKLMWWLYMEFMLMSFWIRDSTLTS